MPREALRQAGVSMQRAKHQEHVDKTRPARNRERKERKGIKSRVAREATSQAKKREKMN